MKNIFIFVILLIAFAIRFLIIGFGLPSKNMALTTYNPDEALSYYTIEKWNPKKFNFHPHRAFLWGGFHLFPLAVSLGIAKLIGYVKLGSREFYINNLGQADRLYIIGRFLMILFAVFSVFAIYLCLKKAYGKNLGLLGALLLTISPAHVFNSIYVRPDIMMLFFCIMSIYFSLGVIYLGRTKYYLLSAFAVGFAAGTKIIAGVFIFVPIIAHFLSNQNLKAKFLDKRVTLLPIFFILFFILSSPYTLIDFNKSSESFLKSLKINFSLSKGAMDTGQFTLFGSGIPSYLRYYLPHGFGVAMVLSSIFGFFVMLINFLVMNKNKYDLFFIISGFIVLLVISSTKNQAVWYTFPFLPFMIIYTIRGISLFSNFFDRFNFSRLVSITLFFVIFLYTAVYSFAHWNLYYNKNVREEASDWISENVPKNSKIAIARSYFWTPPILRQYNPPYIVLEGADAINSSIDEGVLGLEKIILNADYIVLTEFEYRNYLEPKLEKYFTRQVEIIKKIFYNNQFEKIAEFNKNAKFLFFEFEKNYLPGDWLIPNPRILIFKRTN